MGRIQVAIAMGVLLAASNMAAAHGLVISWENTSSKLIVKVTYDSDDPAEDCEVRMTTEDGREFATMKTDREGLAVFKRPPTGNYTITADAGSGHLAKKSIAFPDRPVAEERIEPRWPRVVLGIGIIVILTIGWQMLARKK